MTSRCIVLNLFIILAVVWSIEAAKQNPYAKLLLSRSGRSKPSCKPNVLGLNLVKLSSGHYFFEREEKKSWNKARAFCRNHKMDLLSIETKTEFSAIETYINSILGSGYDGWYFWTSGLAEAKDGTWKWAASNNTQVDPSFFYHKMKNDTRSHNCLATRRHSSQDLKLTDHPCAYSWRFICELNKPCP